MIIRRSRAKLYRVRKTISLFQATSSKTEVSAAGVSCTYTPPKVYPHHAQQLEFVLPMCLNVTGGPGQCKWPLIEKYTNTTIKIITIADGNQDLIQVADVGKWFLGNT